MEIVTGFQGKNHVTAQQLSRLISGLAGDETYVLDTQDQLAIEVVSANKVTIATGDLIAQGTYFTNEAPEDLVIENGVTGLNRNDLIVCRYEKAEPAVDEDGNPDYTIPRIESGDWAVVKGTPSSGTPEDPSVVTASLQDPNTSLAEFPVYRIPIRGLSVGTPERIPPVIPSMREACDSLLQSTRISVAAGDIALRPNGAEVFSVDITKIQEDYRVMGIAGFDSYSADAVITRCLLYENAISGRIRNLISGAHTVRPTVDLLCIPLCHMTIYTSP